MWYDSFFVPEVIPAKLEFCSTCCGHPVVVKINDIAIGAVIDDEWYDLAFTNWEFSGEFQDVSYGCSAEAI